MLASGLLNLSVESWFLSKVLSRRWDSSRGLKNRKINSDSREVELIWCRCDVISGGYLDGGNELKNISGLIRQSVWSDETTPTHKSYDTSEVVSATRNDYEIDNNSQGLSSLCHSIYWHQHKYDMLWHFSLGAMMVAMCSSPEHQNIQWVELPIPECFGFGSEVFSILQLQNMRFHVTSAIFCPVNSE